MDINNKLFTFKSDYSYFYLLLCLVFLYIFIFYIWGEITRISKTADKISNMCIKKCQKTCPPEWWRGDSYSMREGTNPKNCLLTIWELSHFIMHIMIGYYYNLPTSLLVGVPFELWEWSAKDCASMVDILVNTCGALVGIGLNVGYKSLLL